MRYSYIHRHRLGVSAGSFFILKFDVNADATDVIEQLGLDFDFEHDEIEFTLLNDEERNLDVPVFTSKYEALEKPIAFESREDVKQYVELLYDLHLAYHPDDLDYDDMSAILWGISLSKKTFKWLCTHDKNMWGYCDSAKVDLYGIFIEVDHEKDVTIERYRIDIEVTTPDGVVHQCQGVVKDAVVFDSSYNPRQGVWGIDFPDSVKESYVSGPDESPDYDYEQRYLDEMICYAINDGGVNKGEWDSGVKFQITSNYTRDH